MTRRFDGANVAWENRFVVLTDTLLVRATGDSLWQVATAARTAESHPSEAQSAQKRPTEIADTVDV